MARRLCSLSRWHCWSGWPRSSRVLASPWSCPTACWRRAIVPCVEDEPDEVTPAPSACAPADRGGGRWPNPTWAALLQRRFGCDVLACPRCPGRLTLVALMRDPAVIGRILRHLGFPDAVPPMRPARAPPPAVGGRRRACEGARRLKRPRTDMAWVRRGWVPGRAGGVPRA